MIHDARIIPTDGRPHLPPNVSHWMGNSIGRWEGNTLVVAKRRHQHHEQTNFRGAGPNMRLVETLPPSWMPTRSITEFTVNDSTSFTKTWTAQIPMNKKLQIRSSSTPVTKANYAMEGMLGGARLEEKRTSPGTVKGRSDPENTVSG
jgi:hypothetical protein